MPRSPLSACWPHLHSASPPSPRCRSRLPSFSASPLRHPPARSCESASASARRARSREDAISAHLDVRADGPAEWIELELVLPEGVTSVGAVGRTAFRLGAGRCQRLDYELACERWGAYRIGLVDARVRERIRTVVDDGTGRRRAAASGLPPAGAPAPRRAGPRHDSVLGQPGVPRQGGGNRVRRYPPVCSRRPGPPCRETGGRAPDASACTSTRATPSARAT